MNPFALPPRLTRFQVEITTGCNLACAGCPRTIGINEGHWRNKHMPVPRFAAVIANAPPADLLVLQGIGEPTLHPRLPEMIRVARANGRFTYISFNTNALFRELDYYAELRRTGLDHVSVSVDSLTPATAEATRAGTDTAQLRSAIRYLVGLFGPGTTLSIVLSKMNLPELPALLGELYALGGRMVEIQPLIAYSAAMDGVRLAAAEIAQARRIAAEAEARLEGLHIVQAASMTPSDRRCTRPMHAGYVTVDGFVTPCCTTEDSELLGQASLAERPFAELWQGPKFAAWYARFYDRDDPICLGCTFNPRGLIQRESPESESLAERTQSAGALQRQGRIDEAASQFRSVLDEGGSVAALQGLGETALQRGEHAVAARLLDAVQQLAPSPRNAHNLAWALHGAGRRDDAIAQMHRITVEHPDYPAAYSSLARMLAERGDLASAAGSLIVLIRKALVARNMAVVDPAAAQLIALDSPHPQLVEIANHLRLGNRAEAAVRLLDSVLRRDPGDLGAALVRCMARLPVIYADDAQIEACRERYAADLSALASSAQAAAPQALAAGYELVGQAKPFYLAYQGRDDRALQETYGAAVARMVRAALPEPPAPAAAPEPGGKIRVGFASNYLFQHSVAKLFRGWVEKLDRKRFEVFVYNLFAGDADAWAAATSSAADHVRHRLGGAAEWSRQIADDRLHALIYPEIGMETLAVRLGSLRLARVQCVSWGHPMTTGLPAIDYFLSSALMEPEDGDRHYRERLVRLPNLSIHYEPLPMDTGALTRQSLGLEEDRPVFVSCQALYKYLPAHDRVFPMIAAALPAAQFLFIADGNPSTTEAFRARLTKIFAASGLNAARHIVFTPPVAPADFPSLLRSGDVYLDSIGWSGGNTTLEAATSGLPIVTMPGPLMRGRHTAGILRRMGLERFIAADHAAYVATAAALGRDGAARDEAARQVAERRHLLFRDPAPVRALEDFLSDAVRSAR